MKYAQLKEIARKFRNNPTPGEELLWKYIRNDQLDGKRFLRQHPIIYESNEHEHFFFIPDFYCASEKLVVEVDGKVHDYQKDRDIHREEILKAKGLRILRIRNEELKDINKVIEKIRKAAI
ncbi:MAG: endonuclease domain-containing protein [Bacteroidetes bacterium]|nr:endonuclease domain-containing protein [Bacteroidota bacterium]